MGLVVALILLDCPAYGKDLERSFDRLFEFTSPSSCRNERLSGEFVDWNRTELNRVQSLLSNLIVDHPNLAKRASAGSRLKLLKLAKNEKISARNNNVLEFLAFQSPGAIQFSNSFFQLSNESEQEKVLLHELAHAADCGEFIAYSTEFIDYFRRNRKYLLPFNVSFDDFITSRRVEDSILNEALANTYSKFLRDEEIPEKSYFRKNIAVRFSNPSNKERVFLREFIKGHKDLSQGNTKDAITAFNHCIDLYPTNLIASVYLAYCLIETNSNPAALILTRKNLLRLERIRMPEDEKIFQNARRLRALILLKTRSNNVEAQELIDTILRLNPTDSWTKELRELGK